MKTRVQSAWEKAAVRYRVPFCGKESKDGWFCSLPDDHEGPHEAWSTGGDSDAPFDALEHRWSTKKRRRL